MWNNDTKNSDYQPFDWSAAYEESEQLAKARWAQFPPIVKEFYQEHKEVQDMTQEEVDKFRKAHNNILVSHFDETDKSKLPKPAPKFEHSFHNHPDILDLIVKQKFEKPSPIQAQSWPILLQGRDLIGIAQTGTGKTLAYLLPGLLSIVHQKLPRSERVGPSVLILAPTRELAQQIDIEARKYSYQGIKSLCVYGGGDRAKQISACKGQERPEIIIATPGRLNDLIMNRVVNLDSVNYLVLDEADRMLDMGFMPQIRRIMCDVRPDRTTVMMSATWPASVRRIATDFMKIPLQIFVGSLDLAAVSSVSQKIVMTDSQSKRQLLYDFILKTMDEKDKVIVFVGRKSVADDISSELALNDINCQCMHGDRDQADRERALADLKSGDVRIIVATDVASRGLDIDDITYILNYDFPSHHEEYVHRVGRTGRAGKTGKSITFFTREDWRHAQGLIDILQKSEAEIPEELIDMAARYNAWLEKKKAEDELAHSLGGGGRRRGGGRGYGDSGGRGFSRGGFDGDRERGGGGSWGEGGWGNNSSGSGSIRRDLRETVPWASKRPASGSFGRGRRDSLNDSQSQNNTNSSWGDGWASSRGSMATSAPNRNSTTGNNATDRGFQSSSNNQKSSGWDDDDNWN